MEKLTWDNIGKQNRHSYTCGYCGLPLASETGWTGSRHIQGAGNIIRGRIYVCHRCDRPTFFDSDSGGQIPGVSYGESVNNIGDAALNEIYEESRKATSAGCFTAAVLCCRKLLMHLAVDKGAKPNSTFKSYVEYLANNNYVPPDCKPWVEQIKDTGNEANHELVMMKRKDAEDLISFCEMLLKILYEFPTVAKARNGAKATT